jgi:Fe-S-cluster containining protein
MTTVELADGLRHGGKLTWTEARESPCSTCPGTYCCTFVRVEAFELSDLFQVDYAQFLLNFEGVVLGLDDKLGVTVYLNQPCSNLDQETRHCTVHSTRLQPAVCRSYSAYDCYYRARMEHGNHAEFPLVDRARMDWLAGRLLFDEHRRTIAGPDWPTVLAAFESMPMDHRAAPLPPADPVMDSWREVVLTRKSSASAPQPRRYGDAAVSSPCTGCGAWCCSVLVFELGVPTSAGALDQVRYLLGFPSIEVGVAEGDWAIFVHTKCRHHEGGLCSVYGQDERPLRCSYFDPLSCAYKPTFSRGDPATTVRVTRDLFPVLADSIVFDEMGRVLAVPSVDELRGLVESRIRGEG